MKKKLKIGVVIPKYGTVGGGEKFVYELTERIARDPAFAVHVFANRWRAPGSPALFHRIPILKFPRFLSMPSFAWFAKRKIAQVGIDIIHTHERIFDADLFTMHGIPHRMWIETVRKKRLSLFDRAYAHIERRLIENDRCNFLLPVSSITRDAFLSVYNGHGKTVEILHPGVDWHIFHSAQRADVRESVRAKYGFAAADIVVLFVSMNFEIKGLDHLMAGFSMAKHTPAGINLKLLVVGKGNLRKFERLANDLKIAADVRFAGIVETGIERIYQACDLFAMLSRFDTFGLTVLEAMAASLPVLISRQVGAKDIVVQERNGFVVDREDEAAICSCLLTLTDGRRRGAMGQEAFATASNHGWEQVADQVKQVYFRFRPTAV
ncbi:glycosyltransferase family 4 protein [uncultured Desulfosarcina sp.]|uniref:glycosyltransferase family 4 protein n=1 Tax=uncultured Desulfosarcina sp. TaxID=218289 RepID=UPI0029C73169|nr:glycosyltransferase family 4 protein [uncultured Desulfosarcina sp.]